MEDSGLVIIVVLFLLVLVLLVLAFLVFFLLFVLFFVPLVVFAVFLLALVVLAIVVAAPVVVAITDVALAVPATSPILASRVPSGATVLIASTRVSFPGSEARRSRGLPVEHPNVAVALEPVLAVLAIPMELLARESTRALLEPLTLALESAAFARIEAGVYEAALGFEDLARDEAQRVIGTLVPRLVCRSTGRRTRERHEDETCEEEPSHIPLH